MSINNAIRHLYSNEELWTSYRQRIDMINPYTDSCYINHISITDEYVELMIPEHIHLISDICCSDNVEIYVYKEKSLYLLKKTYLFCFEPISLRIRWNAKHVNRSISFNVSIFKNKLKNEIKNGMISKL